MAAGRLGETPGEWFREVVPEAELVRSGEAAIERANGRPLVILTRDAHRHEQARRTIEDLVSRSSETVVVELGLPYWHPSAGAFVATYGAGRVNVEAAASALYSRPRRGVEQSGSSPGS
jgi:beta-N-acetylhexosaminidase